jgi:subtilisin family serine protease
MVLKRIRVAAAAAMLSLALVSGGTELRAADGEHEALIVKCTRPCAAVVGAVTASGGEVTQTYDNVDAIAVRVPRSAVGTLVTLAGADSVRKDITVAAPRPSEAADVTDQLAASDPLADDSAVEPTNYNYNLTLTDVAPLHAAGKRGQNIVVALIDSGSANVPQIPALGGTIIGGETFVPAVQDPLSATHHENGSHGTMTAEMIAAHTAFLFFNTSGLVRALNRYAPGSAIACASLPPGICPSTATVVPMTGTAPAAMIYAMKVFSATGGGAPESRIIAAMDHAITLRRNYNATGSNAIASGAGTETSPFVYSALKIDVVNMSLGGPTLFAGRDLEDQLTLAMLDVGITLVTSAGNDGFGAMTIGSPGTGFGSLTVGAADSVVHERVLRDIQYGAGAGSFYRPSSHIQTAYFSSRGPNADGRLDPDIVANGFASYVHAYLALTAQGVLVDCREPGAVAGSCLPRIVFASGTSFSSPTVAGAAAVLRGAHPAENATQIRNALQQSANPTLLGDDSTAIDQGSGFLDVAAADALLTSGNVSSKLPDFGFCCHEDIEDALGSGGASVSRNVERAGFRIARFQGNRYTAKVKNLKPGEVAQIFLPSDFFTSSFDITVDHVVADLPLDQQNQFFACGPDDALFQCGDDVFVQVIDAPTSIAVARASGFPNRVDPFVATIANPQTGLVRLALQGDWTNGGSVSANVTVTRKLRFDGFPTTMSTIQQDEIDFVDIDVPAGAGKAVFELAWMQNWARYPTNDLDLVLVDPNGVEHDEGATVNSPERVEIANPMPGRWHAAIIGFTIQDLHEEHHGRDGVSRDFYTFRAEADGRRLKQIK